MIASDSANSNPEFVNQCPEENLLVAFNHGNVHSSLIEPISDHLASCTKCQQLVGSLGPDILEKAIRENFGQVDISQLDLDFELEINDSALVKLLAKCEPAAPLDSTRINPLIDKRFNKTKLIGDGQFGSVYLAYDFHLKHPVALKITGEDITFVDSSAEMFLNDIAMMKHWDHPLVPKIYDYGYWKGKRCFAVMEYIGGEKFDRWLRRKRRPVRLAMRFFHQLMGVVEDAHDRNLLHRNLKPANVFLTKEKKIRVTDFGLFLDDRYLANQPEYDAKFFQYNSPEQLGFDSERVGKTTDVYSLGKILDLIVTSCSSSQNMTQSVTMSIDYLKPLIAIAEKCTRTDPDQRYGSVSDLRRAISDSDF